MSITTPEIPLETSPEVPVVYKNAKQRRYEARGARRVADRMMARMIRRHARRESRAEENEVDSTAENQDVSKAEKQVVSIAGECEEQTTQVPPMGKLSESQGVTAAERLMEKIFRSAELRERCAALAEAHEGQEQTAQAPPVTAELLIAKVYRSAVLRERCAALGVTDECQEQTSQAENQVASTVQDDSSLATPPKSLPDRENTSAEKDKSFQSSLQSPLPVGLVSSAAQHHHFQPTPQQFLFSTAFAYPHIKSETVDMESISLTELLVRVGQYGEAANEPQNTSMIGWADPIVDIAGSADMVWRYENDCVPVYAGMEEQTHEYWGTVSHGNGEAANETPNTSMIGWTDPTVDCADLVDMLWQDEKACASVNAGMEEQIHECWVPVDPASYGSWWWPNTDEVEQPNTEEYEERWRELLHAENRVSVLDSSPECREARSSEADIDHIVWGAISDSDSDSDTDRSENSGKSHLDLSGILLSDNCATVPEKTPDGEQHRMQSSENLDQCRWLLNDDLTDSHPTYEYDNVNPRYSSAHEGGLCMACKNILAARRKHCKHGQLSVEERRHDRVRYILGIGWTCA